MRRRTVLGIVALSAMYAGCFESGSSGGCEARDSERSSGARSCLLFCDLQLYPCPNPATEPSGPIMGIGADGRVDVTAAQAWPHRPVSGPPLSAQEIAEGCAAYAACLDAEVSPEPWATRLVLQETCTQGAPGGLWSTSVAQRVIPIRGYDESFEFLIRGALASGGSCEEIRTLLTENRTGLACQEDGCWSTRRATVTCDGEVAILDGASRDCTRSGMLCSEESPTGCSDRLLVRCEPGGADRCDGQIKLGCDRCGFVSYHDCSWNGGECVETDGGAACVPPGAASGCEEISTGCSGSQLVLCVGGEPVNVDCAALGMQGCSSNPEAAMGFESLFVTQALCVPISADAGATDAGLPSIGGDAGASDAALP